jgi:ribonuclease HI
MCSAYMVKLWGVLEGLKYAKYLGFWCIDVEMDYFHVANVLNSGKKGE